jgi:hypothetical protein
MASPEGTDEMDKMNPPGETELNDLIEVLVRELHLTATAATRAAYPTAALIGLRLRLDTMSADIHVALANYYLCRTRDDLEIEALEANFARTSPPGPAPPEV